MSEWAVAESKRWMTQDEVKVVCQGVPPWKMGIFLRGRVELFTRGWVNCCWVPKRDDAGWSENFMSRCNALKNGYLPERNGWALYWRVSELLLCPKEGSFVKQEISSFHLFSFEIQSILEFSDQTDHTYVWPYLPKKFLISF